MSINIENYIPHRQGMRLIDNIIEINDSYARCETYIHPSNLFYHASISGIMPWVGIEFMAQTVAAFAGFQQQKPKAEIGLLLSVRQFICTQPYFKKDSHLIINATKIYLEDNIGVFQCHIDINDENVASARLNTLQPDANSLLNLLSGGLS